MNRVLVPPAASEMHSHFGEPVRGLTLLSTQKKSPASVMRGIFIGGEGGILPRPLYSLTLLPYRLYLLQSFATKGAYNG